MFSENCIIHVQTYARRNQFELDVSQLLHFNHEMLRTVFNSSTKQITPTHKFFENCALHLLFVSDYKMEWKKLVNHIAKSLYKRNPIEQFIFLIPTTSPLTSMEPQLSRYSDSFRIFYIVLQDSTATWFYSCFLCNPRLHPVRNLHGNSLLTLFDSAPNFHQALQREKIKIPFLSLETI